MTKPGLAALLLGVAVVLAAAPAASAAQDAKIAWSTYLRSGPGQAFPAVDELEHDTPVRLVRCDPAWCRVMNGEITGYVDKAALVLPRPEAAKGLKARPNCFVTGQDDYHRQMPTRFCGKPNG